MLEQRVFDKEKAELSEKFDFSDSENMIQFKIVYWGPGESGKTTNFFRLREKFDLLKLNKKKPRERYKIGLKKSHPIIAKAKIAIIIDVITLVLAAIPYIILFWSLFSSNKEPRHFSCLATEPFTLFKCSSIFATLTIILTVFFCKSLKVSTI